MSIRGKFSNKKVQEQMYNEYMLLCKVCKSVLYEELDKIRSGCIYPELNNRDVASHIKQCETQFLDVDDIVKSCFQAYIQQLIEKYKYVLTPYLRPERNKRKDFDKCNKCYLLRLRKISNVSGIELRESEPEHLLDLSEIRCSDHC